MGIVPIYRLLQDEVFGPELAADMAAAFEDVIRTLGLDRTSPAAEVIAIKIIDVARSGVRTAEQLRELALK